MKTIVTLVALVSLAAAAGTLRAEEPETPTLEIPFIAVEPMIDDFLAMELPAHLEGKMARVSGFIQRTPDDGAPSSEPTEVFVAYDRKHLYTIFVAHDSEPERIRANMSPRGAIFKDDSVNIMIDTFDDQRRAYFFVSTPRGLQADGQFTEANGFDSSFEAVWDSEGRVTDRGFVVKIKIPFISLRFPDKQEQTWRVIFNRVISRYNEDSFWPRYTLAIEGRLNQTALMTGIRDISQGRNIQLIPFGFFRGFRIEENGPGGATVDDDNEESIGLDAKAVIKDAMVLDLTLNPDFSQVESDQPQVTVNERFEVFFPELRPFFLENQDIFATPTNLLFTRRIVDPSVGAKLTGKRGRYGFGVLLTDDQEPGEDPQAPPELVDKRAWIGAFRLSRDVSTQSTIGVMLTDRELANGYNRVGAADARIKLNSNWVTRMQAAFSSTREQDGAKLGGSSYNVAFDRSGTHLNMHNHFLYTSEEFDTQLGFLGGRQRPGTINVHNRTVYNFRPGTQIASWGPALFLGRISDTDNNRLDWRIEPEIEWDWVRGRQVELSFTHFEERLRPEDFDALTEPKNFPQSRWALDFETHSYARGEFGIELGVGTRVNFVPPEGNEPELADFRSARAELLLRPIPPLRLDFVYTHLELDNEDGAGRIFTNTLGRVRANWQFTRELSLRVITDYERIDPVAGETSLTKDDRIVTDVLVKYLWNPWWALFVGYNSATRDFQEDDEISGLPQDFSSDGQQVFVKFSYLFQL